MHTPGHTRAHTSAHTHLCTEAHTHAHTYPHAHTLQVQFSPPVGAGPAHKGCVTDEAVSDLTAHTDAYLTSVPTAF